MASGIRALDLIRLGAPFPGLAGATSFPSSSFLTMTRETALTADNGEFFRSPFHL